MAITTTWSNLITLVAEELKRDDLNDRIPNWINQGEFRLSRDIRPRGYQRYVSGNMAVGDKYVVPPTRMLGVISFHAIINSRRIPIFRRSYSWLLDFWPDATSQRDPSATLPDIFYANVDGIRLIVAPTPATAYAMELAYYEKLQPLGDDNETNWLTENAPDLLLYATLLESAPFLRDDPRIAAWTDLYTRGTANMTAVEESFKSDDATTVAGA